MKTNPAYKFLKEIVLNFLIDNYLEFDTINYQHDYKNKSNFQALVDEIEDDFDIENNFGWFVSEHFDKHHIIKNLIVVSQFNYMDSGEFVYTTIYKFDDKFVQTLEKDYAIFDYKFVKLKSKRIIEYYYQ
jgi:hypothetical protein